MTYFVCLACPEAKNARVFHRILVTSPLLTPSLKNLIAKYRATYGMLSWSALLKCRWERYRRHYSHWFPLFRLLADVNRFCGEWFKSGAKAGEHVALLILYVILLHGSVSTGLFTTPNGEWESIWSTTEIWCMRKPFNVKCALRSSRRANQQSSTSNERLWLVG